MGFHIKEESSEQNNNSWKYLTFFQILASTVKLIDFVNYVLILLRVSFLSFFLLTSCCLRFGQGVPPIAPQ